jgi:N-acylglucosamine 2-epimerase
MRTEGEDSLLDKKRANQMLAFYEKHLKDDVLPFWLSKSIDKKNGGFFNCFENVGNKLISRDKYTWSQGRFVWMWSKLSRMKGNTFTAEEKEYFLKLAKCGRDFLKAHCFMDEENDRCTFLMDEEGHKKLFPGQTRYDAGTSADYFVILGFSQYALAANDSESYEIAKKLYYSMKKRVEEGNSGGVPYPIPAGYRDHAYSMSFSNLSCEMLLAARVFAPEDCGAFSSDGFACIGITIREFTDQNHVLHEYKLVDGSFGDSLLARCQKPGHAIEDMWFAVDVMKATGHMELLPDACAITKKAFENGWDDECGGGILLFCDQDGGEPKGSTLGIENEGMAKQVIENWGNKVWWVHSETLYASLLLYQMTGDEEFWDMYQKTAELTFRVFPDPVVGEWIQIRNRNLEPESKIVALPVKDPYHITRDLVYIIELLHSYE